MEHEALLSEARAERGDSSDDDETYGGLELDHTSTYPRPRTLLSPTEILWVTGVILVMVFLHLTSQVFIMWPYYQVTRSFTPKQLARVLIPFNALVAYMYITYYIVLMSDSGGVPPSWSPDAEMAEHGIELSSEHRRYCHKCDAFKPPRAHHCKQCKRCVLKMDHHCPWVGNCVGNNNHAHFMRFLVALTAAGTYLLAMLCLRVIDWWNIDWYLERPSTLETVMLVLNYLVGIPPIVLTSLMMWYQIYLIAINTTTIETHEQDRVNRQIRRGQIPFTEFPFDVGVWHNLTETMGPNVFLWLWPFQRPVHDGFLYPVSVPNADAQFLWPPPDPRQKQKRRPPPESAFTYGEEQLNPALHTQEPQYSNRIRVRRGSEGIEIMPPEYGRMFLEMQQQYEDRLNAWTPGSDHEEAVSEDDAKLAPKTIDMAEDDIPLGSLVRRHPSTQNIDSST